MASQLGSEPLPPWIHAVSGSVSVIVANSLLYPIDRQVQQANLSEGLSECLQLG